MKRTWNKRRGRTCCDFRVCHHKKITVFCLTNLQLPHTTIPHTPLGNFLNRQSYGHFNNIDLIGLLCGCLCANCVLVLLLLLLLCDKINHFLFCGSLISKDIILLLRLFFFVSVLFWRQDYQLPRHMSIMCSFFFEREC